MKKLKAVLLGCGDRSNRYGDYSLVAKDELEIVAAIDINPTKLVAVKAKYNIPEENLFTSLDEFLTKNIQCDFVINGTMDESHYETAIKLLKHKYNILQEKPIVNNAKQLLEIKKTMDENKCKICVCHVLRYTPFYSSIKEIIESGKLGEITDMQLNEHVCYAHFVNAYVRGKWRNSKECGSSFLLAKCCHDTDLMCWLNNATSPKLVSSFGSKSYFNEEHAPKGATKYCYECPNKDKCMFDAYKFELEKDFIPFYTWNHINKPYKEVTREEKIEYLKHDVMGQCVFKTDMDIVDRQCVSVQFKNGSIATLNMIGGTSKAGRHIHIIGTLGEIEGYIEDNKYTLRLFDTKEINYKDQVIELTNNIAKEKANSVAGHYGGDFFIMKNICAYFRGDKTTSSLTKIEDSINSHLICYAADEAMEKGQVIDLEKEYSVR